MVSNDNIIRRIAWNEVFPWLILFRTIPIAISFSVLILALIGTVATPIGWIASEWVFVREQTRNEDPLFAEAIEINRSPYQAVFRASEQRDNNIELLGAQLSGPRAVFARLTDPFRQLFRRDSGGARFGYHLVGCVWSLAVWALIGCGIARICLLRLTRDESAGLDDAFDFAVPRFAHCLGAIGVPLAAVFVLVLPCMFIGLAMSFDLGLLIGSLLWGIVLLCGFLMTLVMIGMFFAWPLVISSIAAEGQSPLDAVTRCLSYVFQKPFHFAFYLLVSVIVGGLSWILVSQLAAGTIQMAAWSGSWGSNVADGKRMDGVIGLSSPLTGLPTGELAQPAPSQSAANGLTASTTPERPSSMFWLGSSLVRLWHGLVTTLAVAFLYGLFWCMAAAIYLLLRQDVDEVELDEIFLDEQSRSFDLPPLKTDANGIPQIQPLPAAERTAGSDETIAS